MQTHSAGSDSPTTLVCATGQGRDRSGSRRPPLARSHIGMTHRKNSEAAAGGEAASSATAAPAAAESSDTDQCLRRAGDLLVSSPANTVQISDVPATWTEAQLAHWLRMVSRHAHTPIAAASARRCGCPIAHPLHAHSVLAPLLIRCRTADVPVGRPARVAAPRGGETQQRGNRGHTSRNSRRSRGSSIVLIRRHCNPQASTCHRNRSR